MINMASINTALQSAMSAQALSLGISLGTINATIMAAIATETTLRSTGVSTLTANLASLTTNLATEVQRANTAESILQTNLAITNTNLNNEISNRTSLSSSLIAEISRAQLAEATITTDINTESSRARLAEATITTVMNTEISRAQLAEGTITTAINTEISRAQFAEATIATAINTEISRAQTAEATITALISTNNAASSNTTSTITSVGQEYWVDCNINTNEIIGTTLASVNQIGQVLSIIGVGFQQYYHPQFQASFLCIYTNNVTGVKTTPGVVMFDFVSSNTSSFLFYHVECPVPVYTFPIVVTVSLQKSTGQIYPFGGFTGFNIVTYNYFWKSVFILTSNAVIGSIGDVIVNGGFNSLNTTKYRCYLSGLNSTGQLYNITFIGFLSTSSTLDCGPNPSLLGISTVQGTNMLNLNIYEYNSSTATNGLQVICHHTLLHPSLVF